MFIEVAAEEVSELDLGAERNLSGAKAQVHFAAFSARLKSCPVTKRRELTPR
jgi:hypothetical protein